VLIIVLTFLGLLLTFGAVFPPLAVALMVTILATVLLTKLKVGRFLSLARERGLQQYVELVEKECQGVGAVSVLHNSMWMLITISCWFYTLFLFDTLGDAVGFDKSLWVLVVIPLIPLMIYILSKWWIYVVRARKGNKLAVGSVSLRSECHSVNGRETSSIEFTNTFFEDEQKDNSVESPHTFNILQKAI
jgi:hypothetical protein